MAGSRASSAEGMQERLNRLESLVTTLATQDHGINQVVSGGDESTVPSSVGHMSRDAQDGSMGGLQHGLGVLKVDDNSSVYRGSTHWRDVMEEVIKVHFQN